MESFQVKWCWVPLKSLWKVSSLQLQGHEPHPSPSPPACHEGPQAPETNVYQLQSVEPEAGCCPRPPSWALLRGADRAPQASRLRGCGTFWLWP